VMVRSRTARVNPEIIGVFPLIQDSVAGFDFKQDPFGRCE
jgi:hypothetical protein